MHVFLCPYATVSVLFLQCSSLVNRTLCPVGITLYFARLQEAVAAKDIVIEQLGAQLDATTSQVRFRCSVPRQHWSLDDLKRPLATLCNSVARSHRHDY